LNLESYPGPFKPARHEHNIEIRKKTWLETAQKLKNAKTVLIVGGGLQSCSLMAQA